MTGPTSISATKSDVDKEITPSETGAIYVDVSVPAVRRCSEPLVTYLTLREAITAWLALPLNASTSPQLAPRSPRGLLFSPAHPSPSLLALGLPR